MTWTSPDGDVLDLTTYTSYTNSAYTNSGVDLFVRPEVAGLGAAPRTVTRQALATGGSRGRWSHAGERLLTVPLFLAAATPQQFLAAKRSLTLAFTSTAPPAGPPRPGLLRVTRADGSWREIGCVYLGGLEGEETPGSDLDWTGVVLELVALDPWWYSAQRPVLEFAYQPGRSYLAPYETVSPDTARGTRAVTIHGDVPASPVWTLTGPADTVTVADAETGRGWSFGAIDPGQTITVDTETATVTDHTGANRVGDLAWPDVDLFTLPPGTNRLLLEITGGIQGQSAITLTYRPRWETA